MTVEQSPLDNHCKQPAERDQQGEELILEQLKEITGVKDARILGRALEASRTRSGRYDLSRAVSVLVDQDTTDARVAQGEVSAGDGGSPQKRPAKVIDLTTEGDDLQKAIALSLQEQQQQQAVVGVSAEERDISRALEQSLGTKRKRGQAWRDPLDPHERRRQGDWPVGLKNIGNTCWFSAVIQSLFHLRAFRRLVLAFDPSRGGERLELLLELRRLFGLLGATERRYVDPSGALALLRDTLLPGAAPDGQQDVSEFTHKLLDWLEDAFSGADRDREELANPMVHLFYGQYRTEGENEGRPIRSEERFGQYPLRVNGFGDLHESLEAAVTQEFESDARTRSGQQTWFTRLPPVLVFELSRFQFNQALGKPEKIHHRLDFPELLYMDRYMEYNKNITQSKREEVRRLQAQRDQLRNRLEKYVSYGSGAKRVPLCDVLQYTLEFVESRAAPDVEMGSPSSGRPAAESASPSDSRDPQRVASRSASGDTTQPSPRHVSDAELRVLQGCLRRWRSEVENDVKELREGVCRLDAAIRDIYNEPSLLKVSYRLHAVLVHEGQAASGHYWAYVRCPRRGAWLKFNDVTVSEASWSDLLKDSVGGRHCASAYCLFYVDRNNKELFDEVKDCDLELPPDLAQYVEEDNDCFRKEMEQWDREQRREQQGHAEAGEQSEVEVEHAQLVLGATQHRLQQVGGEPGALAKALEQEEARLQRLARMQGSLPTQDVRLQHPGVYLLLNGAGSHHLKRLLLEQFAHPALEEEGSQGHALRQESLQGLAHLRHTATPVDEQGYHAWHLFYARYRKVVAAFVAGMEELRAGRMAAALPLLADACALNEELREGTPPPGVEEAGHLSLEPRLLAHFRRKCLLEVNRRCAEQFESGSGQDGQDPLQLMGQLVVPCLAPLNEKGASPEDVAAAEEVRNCWCSMLALSMPGEKQKQLQELLSTLLDPGTTDTPGRPQVPLVRNAHLNEAFERVVRRILDEGECPELFHGTPL